MKKILNLLLVSLFLLLSFNRAFANEVADIKRKGSINITLKNSNQDKIDGIELALYKVADVEVNNGYIFRYSNEFKNFINLNIDDNIHTANYPLKLAEVVSANKLTPRKKDISKGGVVKFSDLEMGLYLFVQTNSVDGYVSINPFLVTMPVRNSDGTLTYDIEATPKAGILKEVIPPPTPEKLPYTGQLWWPVWLLGGVGIILVTVGYLGKINEEV